MEFELSVTFPLNENWIKTDAKIQKTVKKSISSGAGFGERDIEWVFDTEDKAKEAEKKIKALKISKLKTFIMDRE